MEPQILPLKHGAHQSLIHTERIKHVTPGASKLAVWIIDLMMHHGGYPLINSQFAIVHGHL